VELRCVFAQQNCLTRIEHLSHLTRLDTLNLSGNRLASLDGIEALTSLTSLQASPSRNHAQMHARVMCCADTAH
jgi:hypothetical protein